MSGHFLQPITFITDTLQKNLSGIQEALQNVRAMFNNVRNSVKTVSEETMGRLLNITIPLQQIVISFKDMMGKVQGTMTAGLFTALGTYFSLQSVLGAIAEFIVNILVALAILIAGLWAVPMTWGAAAANTAIFTAIAIPFAVILAFMKQTLKINTKYKIPKVKCFDENTKIKMNNGTLKRICEICPGEKLQNNNTVTGIFKVEKTGSIMYILYGVIVSDSHIVKYGDKWIHVKDHPYAFRLDDYDKPYLYCLNTISKTISVNNVIFTDWDELCGSLFSEFKSSLENQNQSNIPHIDELNRNIQKCSDIHTNLEYGYDENTRIVMSNGKTKRIKDVRVGDTLREPNNYVYGITIISKSSINQSTYDIGNSHRLTIKGRIPTHIATNLFIKSATTEPEDDNKYLYNLVTYKGTIPIYLGDISCEKTDPLEILYVPDYNYAIDSLIYL